MPPISELLICQCNWIAISENSIIEHSYRLSYYDIILVRPFYHRYCMIHVDVRYTVCPEVEKTKMDNFLLFNIWGIYLVENTLNYH